MEYVMNELYHHGILGQRWGKKNGPPYPLKESDHSASEKKAGWKKSLGKSSDIDIKSKKSYTVNHKREQKRLTSEQKKKLIKIGAAVAVAGLAAYGGYTLYKNGAFDKLSISGQTSTEKYFAGAVNPSPNAVGVQSNSKAAKQYIESIQNSLDKANPFRYDANEQNVCVPSEIAGFLRDNTDYKNATAKGTGGEMISTYDALHECFSGFIEEGKQRNILETNVSTKFAKGEKEAAEFIMKRLDVEAGAEGVCSVKWKKRLPDGSVAGHTFGWKAIQGENGLEIVFKDYSQGHAGEDISYYFNGIDETQKLLIARLDKLERNEEGLMKYVNLA